MAMATSDENLVQNFAKMVKGIENQTKLLKYSYSLHGALLAAEESGPGQTGATASSFEVKEKLTNLSSNISNFQINLNEFEEFLDNEIQCLNDLQEFQQNQLIQQQETIQQIQKAIPSFFLPQNGSVSNNNKRANATPMASVLLIELNEFEKIPKSTRSRLTLEHIIESLNQIQQLILQKEERLRVHEKSRSSSQISALEEYRSFQHLDHQGKMFLTEKELRTSIIFEGGDATGRAILRTLRALHRLKLVRSNGESTYILVNK